MLPDGQGFSNEIDSGVNKLDARERAAGDPINGSGNIDASVLHLCQELLANTQGQLTTPSLVPGHEGSGSFLTSLA